MSLVFKAVIVVFAVSSIALYFMQFTYTDYDLMHLTWGCIIVGFLLFILLKDSEFYIKL